MTLVEILLAANIVATVGFGVAMLNAIKTNNTLRARDDAWIGTRVDQIWQRTVAEGLTPDAIFELSREIDKSRARAGV